VRERLKRYEQTTVFNYTPSVFNVVHHKQSIDAYVDYHAETFIGLSDPIILRPYTPTPSLTHSRSDDVSFEAVRCTLDVQLVGNLSQLDSFLSQNRGQSRTPAEQYTLGQRRTEPERSEWPALRRLTSWQIDGGWSVGRSVSRSVDRVCWSAVVVLQSASLRRSLLYKQ